MLAWQQGLWFVSNKCNLMPNANAEDEDGMQWREMCRGILAEIESDEAESPLGAASVRL